MSHPLSRLLVALVVLFMLGPMLLVVLFSFSANPLIGFPIERLTLDWYRATLDDAEFRLALRNSLVVAGATALIATLTGGLAGYALARLGPRFAPLQIAIAFPAMLPTLVVGILVVVLFSRIAGVPLGFPSVIAGHVLVTQPFVMLIVLARMSRFDFATVEAARDLGAGPLAILLRVVLPQIGTALVGAALVAMAISLDDFIITVFAIGSGNTLSTFVWGKMRTTLDPGINAIATILIVMTVGAALIALRLTRYRG